MRDNFLLDHNVFRNSLASGRETSTNGGTYPAAARMREMLWDQELEYLAGLHAKQCNRIHDKCRNTKRFPHSGQNLGYMSFPKDSHNITIENFVNKIMKKMFLEKDLPRNAEEYVIQFGSEM